MWLFADAKIVKTKGLVVHSNQISINPGWKKNASIAISDIKSISMVKDHTEVSKDQDFSYFGKPNIKIQLTNKCEVYSVLDGYLNLNEIYLALEEKDIQKFKDEVESKLISQSL
jgi:hypothetical protein